MTNKKGSFPSRKGILKKIFSRKVIGLLIVLLSLLFLTGFYISRPTTEVSAEAQERFGIEIVEKHISSLQESGYEDVSYDVSAIIKMSEENHIPLNITRQPGETLEDMIIRRYDYYATYYVIYTNDKAYLFKNDNDASSFVQKISKYDGAQYSIEKTKKLINNETSQDEINEIIEIKKKEYEKKKAEEEARRKAAAERAKSKSTTSSQSVTDLQSYAHNLVINTYGWSEYDFECLVKLWNRESGWNPNAHNKSSSAHGVPQSLPASKMASEGADYYTNGYTQIRWGLKYIKNRYGSPSGAWAHSQRTGWY